MSEATNEPIKISLPTGIEMRLLCKAICEAAEKHFEDPENVRKFNEWLKRKKSPNDLPPTYDL
mgnify:CR=1 FL=1